MTRPHVTMIPETDRYWAVGSTPARLAHRVVGEWPGHGYMHCACGAGVALHGETFREGWGDLGGQSYDFDEIPGRYRICLKCVAADDTVE